jgi:hypothetical protein
MIPERELSHSETYAAERFDHIRVAESGTSCLSQVA